MSVQVPPGFGRDWEQRRAAEQQILWEIIRWLESQAIWGRDTAATFSRLTPTLGSKIDPQSDVLGFFIPGSALVLWARPQIDFHFPHQLGTSNLSIVLGATRGDFTREELAHIAAILKSSGSFRIIDRRGYESPRELSANGLPLEYEWRLCQVAAMTILKWGEEIIRICSELLITVPEISHRLHTLDVSRLCDEDGCLGSSTELMPALLGLLGPEGSVNYIIGMDAGGAVWAWSYNPNRQTVQTADGYEVVTTIPAVRNRRRNRGGPD